MRKTLGLTAAFAAVVAAGSLLGVHALAGGGKTSIKADTLTGYQESVVGAISTTATGSFRASIDEDAQTIDYRLAHSGLTGTILFSHIHLGDRAQSGGVIVFLCGGGGKPACPQPADGDEAVVTGTITPGDVIGPSGQGIAGGEFGELVAALRSGATYVNVHSSTFVSGEIRGQINDDDQRQP
jgi:hypothetical protein